MHNVHLHIFVTDLRGYVRCLLGVEGAIFNLIPIAEKLGTPEGLMAQITNSWKDENEQLEILLQPWLKKNGETKELDSLRKDLEDLKEEGKLSQSAGNVVHTNACSKRSVFTENQIRIKIFPSTLSFSQRFPH